MEDRAVLLLHNQSTARIAQPIHGAWRNDEIEVPPIKEAPMPTMKAAVIRQPGGPEVLKIESLPIPIPKQGEVLIRVKAFGLNRSELLTRQGHSPNVKFPRVLGIEAVGTVEEAPGKEFSKGDVVATVMGGMGRQFDGGLRREKVPTPKAVAGNQTQMSCGNLGTVP